MKRDNEQEIESAEGSRIVTRLVLPATLAEKIDKEAERTGNSYVATIRSLLDAWFRLQKGE